MNKISPTPRPWHVDDNSDILDQDSLLVARPQHKRDAELICRAVNSHDALVKALADIVLQYDSRLGLVTDAMLECANLALALAGKTPSVPNVTEVR